MYYAVGVELNIPTTMLPVIKNVEMLKIVLTKIVTTRIVAILITALHTTKE